MVPVIERTLALLALAALSLTVVTAAGLLRRRLPHPLPTAALPVATAVAAVATAGSLFLSEVAGYVPCTLCWYQRIAMYPLVVVLGVALLRDDRQVWRTAVPLAGSGLLVSLWHVAVERRPALGGVCDPAAPCSVLWVREFGFLTIPTMAAIGFAAVIVLSLAARGTGRLPAHGHPEDADHHADLQAQ